MNSCPHGETGIHKSLKTIRRKAWGFDSLCGHQYCYLLGLYLGDGYINLQNRKYNVYKLRLTQDTKYPILINQFREIISTVLHCKSGIVKRKNSNSVDVYGYSKIIPILFPHIGKGLKHNRKIILTFWQQKLINKFPWEFLKGLIQTDGSRYLQTISGKSEYKQYLKYNFTNCSKDITDFLLHTCNTLQLRPTVHSRNSLRNNRKTGAIKYTVTFNKLEDVNRLEMFIGPKT